MSVFSFPRINVKGLMTINVCTANNDDYSGTQFPPGDPNAGLPVRLTDTKTVQPLTYGMSDEKFIAWVQQPHPFVKPPAAARASVRTARSEDGSPPPPVPAPEPVTQIPGEWNYYGDMGLTMLGVKVLAVQHADRLVTDEDGSGLIGAELSFKNQAGADGYSTGLLIDVNPEDSPCSQVFSSALTLEKQGKAIFSGKPSKAVTRWINFQRNTNLTGPNGAGGCFQCVVPLSELAGQPILDLLPPAGPGGEKLAGLVFRYYLYRPLQPINVFAYQGSSWFEKMVALYQKQGLNPDYAEISGTLAPWFAGEMESLPTGRVLNPTQNTIPLKEGDHGNGPAFRLAPAVLQAAGDRISVDFSGTFPDRYQGRYDPLQVGDNAKYDFGAVSLALRREGAPDRPIGAVKYQDTAAGDLRGWMFDFPLQGVDPAEIEKGDFVLIHHTSPKDVELLAESEVLIASDQTGLFGEQVVAPPGVVPLESRFLSQSGTPEPATVRVFRKGRELTAGDCPPITVWQYDTTPNQNPGQRERLQADLRPGEPLTVNVGKPGNRLFAFTLPGQPDPPLNYGDFNATVVINVSLRILPNDREYAQYYQDPQAPQPVGNDRLTFQVIFDEVLRNYYLIFPAMSLVVPLNEPQKWENPKMAAALLERTSLKLWDRLEYMPRTRDLSASRRRLLHAWCRKHL
jgi:hypothetical protein